MPVTVDQFGNALVAAGLLTADAMKELWGVIPADARPKNGEGFAQLLVDRGKLTAFQAKEILAGRGARLILGEYVVLQEIGAGGMGQVYKARHRRMERVVALKVMSAAAMKDEASVKRFQREVRAAAKLEHPNIVTAYDSGEAGSVNYLVMQFVDGGDLSSLVKHNGPLPIERAVDYVIQAANGLAFAHGEGVIHRDIKPANLLVDKKGVVKILDMGLARIESNDDGLTATEQVMGTVDYMSPEQAANTKTADARADIYSLGCTLWFLLTGKKLYDGDTMISRLMAHRDCPLPSLVKARDDAPWPLEQAFHKMIAKRVDDRFQTMDEAIAALASFAGGGSSSISGGSNAGIGSQTNAELAAFLQHVGPQTSTGGTGFGTTKTATSPPSSPTAGFDATASFERADEATDPKSQVLATKQLLPKSVVQGTKSSKPTIKLIAAGLAVATLVVFGIFWAKRDNPGETVKALNSNTGPASPIKSATPSGTVSASSQPQAAGTAGYALEFDGQGYLQSKGWEDHALEPPLTIEGLFKLSERQPVSGQPPLLFFHGQFGLKFNTAGNRAILEFGNHQSATLPYYRHQTESVIEPNRPVHLAVVWTPGNLLLFNDGRLTGSHTVPAFTTRTVLNHFISASSFVGSVDEIRISRAARYENDFQPQSRFEVDPQTLALYHCDDGVGGLLTDASPNRLHGQIQGGKWVKGSLVTPPRAASPPSMFESAPSSAVVPPPGDYALKFDGYSVVEFQEIIDYSPHSCTIEGYVRPDAYVPRSTVFSFGGQNGLGLDFSDGKHWQMSHVMSQGGHYHARSSKAAELGKRVHLAGVCDQSEFRLYVDGKLSGSSANGATSFALAKNRPLIGSQFQGVIDEIRISKKPRYASDFRPVARHESDSDTLALYRFDEGVGNVLNDASGNNLHGWIDRANWVRADGTPIPPPGSTPPPSGDHALTFEYKADARLELPNVFDRAQPYTFEAWVEPHTIAGWRQIVEDGPIAVSLRDGAWRAEATLDQGYAVAISQATAKSGQRVHVAATFDGKRVRLFLDGQLAAETPQHDPFKITGRPMVIGAHRNTSQASGWADPFIGSLDEIRISRTIRYDGPFVPPPRHTLDADTAALYHCDEGAGERLTDSTGNNLHGQIIGAKWTDGRSPNLTATTTAPAEWQSLFNGSDLHGWKVIGDGVSWSVGQGVLVGQANTSPGWLMSTSEYSDFELELEFKVTSEANSGVYLRAMDDRVVTGSEFHEIQILDDAAPRYANVRADQHTGSLYGKLPQTRNFRPTVGQWHTLQIRAVGPLVAVAIDKVSLVEGVFPAGKSNRGHIGLQGHTGRVEFRNLRIREIPAELRPEVIGPASTRSEYAVDFTGTNGLSLREPTVDNNQPFTMECVATPLSLPTEGDQWNSPVMNVGWAQVKLFSQPAQKKHVYSCILHHENDQLTTITIGPAVAGKPTRIAIVSNGREVRSFMDGKLVRRDPIASPLRNAPGCGVARYNASSSKGWASFPGLIDEVRFSKTARYDQDYVPQARLESDADTAVLLHFDEGFGDVVKDSSGNNRQGTIVGAKWVRTNGGPAATPAPTRYALQFDGASSVETPDIPWGGLSEVTSEAWVRAEDDPPKDGFLVDRYKATNLTRYQGRWQFTVKYAGEEFPSLAAQSVAGPVGRWEHVAGVLKDGKSYLFVDGKLLASKTLEKPIDLGQGQKLSLGTRLKASIRAVRVSKTARYLAEFTPSAELAADPDTLLLYRFDEGAGGVLHDRSGHGLDGKIVGANWVPADEESAANPAATASGGEIDLLAGLDIVGNAVAGKFALDAGGLRVTDGTPQARIYLPMQNLATEYDLEIRVQRIGDGGQAFGIGFVRSGEQGMIIADGYSNPPAWALEVVDGQSARASGSLVPGARLSDKAPHDITVRVRKDGVSALCDGATVIDWKGDPGRLTTASMWQVPRKDQLFIGFQGPYAVHSATLKPVNAVTTERIPR